MTTVKSHIRAIGSEESFSLAVMRIGDSERPPVVDVPVVNRWLQVDVPARGLPSLAEERAFFADLAALVDAARRARAIERWYFVLKPPGVRLRFRAPGTGDVAEAARPLLEIIHPWIGEGRWGWAAPPTYASYFEQRELLSGLHVEIVDEILMRSADLRLAAASDPPGAHVAAWAAFTVAFLFHYLQDGWWVWEALGRFARLRGAAPPGPEPSTAAVPDPSSLFAALAGAPSSPTFAASVSLLTCLNYIYNQWGLTLETQQRVLDLARRITRPELVET